MKFRQGKSNVMLITKEMYVKEDSIPGRPIKSLRA